MKQGARKTADGRCGTAGVGLAEEDEQPASSGEIQRGDPLDHVVGAFPGLSEAADTEAEQDGW